MPSGTKPSGIGSGSMSPSENFIDPEDIPFGECRVSENSGKPRKRPIYALVWTHRRHRVYKTKARAQVKLKAWKRWYERQGWKVNSHATGYFAVSPDATLQGAAAKSTERHAISLHEYDRDTHERLK